MTQRPIEILLVEDSPSDVWLTRQALLAGAVPKNINTVSNGEQAIDFLRRRGPYVNAPRPDLVLLDLNLPRVNGLEVLLEIKTDPILKSITVIVLTTSEAAVDVNAAYDLNANCYVVKPTDYEQFLVAIRGIEEFWMRLASLPGFTSSPGPSKEGIEADAASASRRSNRKRRPSGEQLTAARTRRARACAAVHSIAARR